MTAEKPKLSEQDRKELLAYLDDVSEMMAGTGKHADHTQQQVGRCVYCSCGMRVQRTAAAEEDRTMTAVVTTLAAAAAIGITIALAASQHQAPCQRTSQPVGWYTAGTTITPVYACEEP